MRQIITTVLIGMLLLMLQGIMGSDLYAQGATHRYYVTFSGAGDLSGDSWANAATDLPSIVAQAGVLAGTMSDPVEVWIGAGEYMLAAPLTLPSGVYLFGGFAGSELEATDRDLSVNVTIFNRGLSGSGSVSNGSAIEAIGSVGWRLDGITVKGGATTDAGGAVQCLNGSGYVSECVFVDNRSEVFGGAVNCGAGAYRFDRCSFQNNFAETSGGALTITNGSTVTLSLTEFAWNNTAGLGGATFIHASSVDVHECRWQNNYSANDGGGVYAYGVTPVDTSAANIRIYDSVFLSNKAERSGAAMYIWQNSHAEVVRCEFTTNHANLGNTGGIFVRGEAGIAPTTIFVDSCRFNGQLCLSDGAALYLLGRVDATVANTIFQNNTAYGAGGLVDGGAGGGAIVAHLTWYQVPALNLTNCLFTGNEVKSGRGAAVSYYCGGAFEPDDMTEQVIVNSIFDGNIGSEAFYWTDEFNNLNLNNNVFLNNELGAYGDTSGTVQDTQISGLGTGNLSVDPCFASVEDQNYHLNGDSPLIDAGWMDIALPLRDADSRTRVMDGEGDNIAIVDIGPFEYVGPKVVWDVAPVTEAHWRLDDKEKNAVVVDEGGEYPGVMHHHPKDWTLPASVDGKIDRALRFHDREEYVEFGELPAADILGDFAISGWFQVPVSESDFRAMFMKYDLLTGMGFTVYLADQTQHPGTEEEDWLAGLVMLGSGGIVQLWGWQGVDDDLWHHYVMQRSGAVMTLYLDGQLVDTQPLLSDTAQFSSGGNATLAYTPDLGIGFEGACDDVRLFSRSLNQTEISALYNNGAGTGASSNHAPYFLNEWMYLDWLGVGQILEDTLAGRAADIDPEDTLSFRAVSGPSWMTVETQGDLSGMPAQEDVGDNVWTVEVSDGRGGTREGQLIIPVVQNTAPSFITKPLALPDAMVNWPYWVNLDSYVDDPDLSQGDMLSFDSEGTPQWMNLESNGEISGVAGFDEIGTSEFIASVSDRCHESDSTTVTLAVVDAYAKSSIVSPMWIEERLPANVEQVEASVDNENWFAAVRENASQWYLDNSNGTTQSLGVVLDANQAVTLRLMANNGDGSSYTMTQSLTWSPTVIGDVSKVLQIRQGDSLLLTTSVSGSVVEIDADGDGSYELTGQPGDKYPTLYETAGVYVITARVDGVDLPQTTVEVVGIAADPLPLVSHTYFMRQKDISSMPAQSASQVHYVASDPSVLEVEEGDLDGFGNRRVYLWTSDLTSTTLQARLGSETGPVLAEIPFRSFEITFDLDAYYLVETLEDGSRVVQCQQVMTPWVPGIDMTMFGFAPGVTFDDSTVERTVYSSDFEDHGTYGSYRFNLILAPGSNAICHVRVCFQDGVPVAW